MNWIPPGSTRGWEEVYRATTHGFDAAAFHAHCDRRARLLVLVQAKEGGWLFGGFTAVGFHPRPGPGPKPNDGPNEYDTAFLFSLTNALGCPEKLSARGDGYRNVFYAADSLAVFGGWYTSDFSICDNADKVAHSFTRIGSHYSLPASTGAHPMAQGLQQGWLAAEIVAWVV